MLLSCISLLVLLVTGAVSSLAIAKPVQAYLPAEQNYLLSVPKPIDVFGYELGQRHLRYWEVLDYVEQLALSSKRIKLTNIGRTYQARKQVILTISSPENITNIEQILAKRQPPLTKQTDAPLVVWLGYGVHGNETSGVNAAMAVAYYLAASQSEKVSDFLKNIVIVIEPIMNPDGMARFVNHIDTFRGASNNTDAEHLAHISPWPSGRGNHFGFDLNRDWLFLTQQESQQRMAIYQQYLPNVLADYHEMDSDSTYFFQPGITSRVHPLTPKGNVEITKRLAKFHANALDQHQRLYFSEQGYDDFYYGKGSSYPDINGGIGLLFEQASSKGFAIDSSNGLLTLQQGIENNVLTSLSTLEGAFANRRKLHDYRQQFYQDVDDLADDEDFDGYFVYEAKDHYRLQALLKVLHQHQIKIYPLRENFQYDDKSYQAEHGYYIPLAQPQYRVIKALFSQQKDFGDNRFYDISGWTLPLAMNIEFYAIEQTRALKVNDVAWQPTEIKTELVKEQDAYGYIFEWQHMLSAKLLNELLQAGVKVRAATESFYINTGSKKKKFTAGSIVVTAGEQQLSHWREYLVMVAQQNNIPLFPVMSGLTPNGPDLGGQSMVSLTPVKVLLLADEKISTTEVGEVLYYLDHLLNIAVTVVKPEQLLQLNLNDYSHVLMVDGQYNVLSEKMTEKLRNFAFSGGVIWGQKHAVRWLAENRFLKARLATQTSITMMYEPDRLAYKDKQKLLSKQQITGAIFNTRLDLSHPLTFGYQKATLPVFRDSSLILEKTMLPFAEVIKYTKAPLLSGYTDNLMLERIEKETVLVAHNLGKGRVIASTDNLLFRGYWHGSAKIFINSLFFAKLIDSHVGR